MEFTGINDLRPGLESSGPFDGTIEGILVSFRPVKRCPATSRDVYGDPRVCLGIWYDYANRTRDAVPYRFCPKVPDATRALDNHLWETIIHYAEGARERRQKSDEAQAHRRRVDAALGLLETCLEVEELRYWNNDEYREAIGDAIAKAKSRMTP